MLVSLTAADFLRYLTWAIFVLIGCWAVARAARHPTPVNIDAGLLFGGLAFAIICTALLQAGAVEPSPFLTSLVSMAVLAMPFLLVRLIDDVIGVPRRLMRLFMGAFAVYVACVWLLPRGLLPLLVVPLLLGLIATLGYVVVASVGAARRAQGITRRRLIAVSVGSLCLALNFGAGRLPISPDDARSLVDIFGLAAGICYYIGFAPPRWLRRIWQGPELRAFLARSASLPQIADRVEMLRAMERGVAAALGTPGASVGLWDEAAGALVFPTFQSSFTLPVSSELPAARAFRRQEALFSRDTHYHEVPEGQRQFRSIARAVLAAPISAGGRRLGVLSVFAPRVSLLADDDLALLQLLADQAAVVLEGRRVGELSARVQAREEAARLKEDFLSAAAHDLKTPLTTLVAQAQLFERRATRDPAAPVDRDGLRRLVAETQRLRAMVLELLDAARAEQGRLVGPPEPVDLAAAAREVARRHEGERHRFVVEAPARLVGEYDRRRIEQLLENLAENAVKYSPEGGTVTLRLWEDEAGAHLTVADEGIGVPADDLPHLFERFHRGANVDDRRFPGWGLGLSISQRIVEQHGGTIAVSSRAGVGSTFHVTLPHAQVPEEPHPHGAAHPYR